MNKNEEAKQFRMMTWQAERAIVYLLSGSFFLVPLVVWTGHFHPFVSFKNFVFACSVLLGAGIFFCLSLREGEIKIRKGRLSLAVAVYSAYIVCSYVFFPYTDRKTLSLDLTLVLLCFLVSSLNTLRSRDYILQAVIAAALVASMYGCFQFFGLNVVDLPAPVSRIGFGVRVTSTFGHPNLVGGFSVGVLPLMAGFGLDAFSQKKRYLACYFGVGFMTAGAALFFCQTRGSWIACTFSCGLFILLWRGRVLNVLFTRYALIAIMTSMLAVVGLYAAFQSLMPSSLRDPETWNFRWQTYANTLKMIQERPILGRGLGTFSAYYPLYQDDRLVETCDTETGALQLEHPHNEHLEILSDGGLVAYGLFLWMVFETIVRLLQRRNLKDIGLVTAIIGMLCDGLFSQNLRYIVILSLFWLCIGSANIEKALSRSSQDWRISVPRFLQPVGIGLVSVVFGTALVFFYNTLRADAFVKEGMAAYMEQHLQQATIYFDEALQRDSRNIRALYYGASAQRLLGARERAIQQYTSLLERKPYFLQANYHLGGIYAKQGEFEKAASHFERQVAADTMHWKSYYNLALLALHKKQREDARQYVDGLRAIHAICPIPPEILQKIAHLN